MVREVESGRGFGMNRLYYLSTWGRINWLKYSTKILVGSYIYYVYRRVQCPTVRLKVVCKYSSSKRDW